MHVPCRICCCRGPLPNQVAFDPTDENSKASQVIATRSSWSHGLFVQATRSDLQEKKSCLDLLTERKLDLKPKVRNSQSHEIP